jgi:hypothetical protein
VEPLDKKKERQVEKLKGLSYTEEQLNSMIAEMRANPQYGEKEILEMMLKQKGTSTAEAEFLKKILGD